MTGHMKDSHRLFLQSFMSRWIMDAKEVKMLYKSCCERFNEDHLLQEENRRRLLAEFMVTINNNIKPFHMEVRKGFSEEDGTNCYCLVSTSDTSITKLASDYTPSELEYFKKLIEMIVESDAGNIGSTQALNATEALTQIKKITKTEADHLLKRLQDEKWLHIISGKVSLSTRSLLELDMYIQDTFPDVATTKMCELCNKLCIQGQDCKECGVKLHVHCAVRNFSKQKQKKCPGRHCSAPWVHEIPSKDASCSQMVQVENEVTPSEKRKRKAQRD